MHISHFSIVEHGVEHTDGDASVNEEFGDWGIVEATGARW